MKKTFAIHDAAMPYAARTSRRRAGRAVRSPAGLSLDPSSGDITGTLPDNGATTTVYAGTDSSSGVTASTSFYWTVNPPAVTMNYPGNQINDAGDSVDVNASGYSSDGYALSYYATAGLPAGLGFDTSTGEITGTIADNAASTTVFTATVTGTDSSSGVAVNTTFYWTVNPPAVTMNYPGNQINDAGDSVDVNASGYSSDGYALSYYATGLPAGLGIDSSTGEITGTIADNAASTAVLTVTVTGTDSSSGVAVNTTFYWTVNPPAVTMNYPGNQINDAGDSVDVNASGYSSDGYALSYYATGLPAGLGIDSSTGEITGTIADNAASTTVLTVTVTGTDSSSGVAVNTTFYWTVNPPAVTMNYPGNQINDAGDSVDVNASGYSSDGYALSYYAAGLPAGLGIDNSTGEITGTVAAADATNIYAVTITGIDPSSGVMANTTFYWTVNAPPVALSNPGDQTNFDGDTVALDLSATDIFSGPFTYTGSGLPSGLSVISGTGAVTGTIASGADADSPYEVTVTATDPATGGTGSQGFNWYVSPVTVTLTSPGGQTNNDGDAVGFYLSATDSAGHALTYTVDPDDPLPPGLSLDPASGRIYGVISDTADEGSPYTVTVIATDSAAGASDTQTFTWTVNWVVPTSDETVTTCENEPIALTAADFGLTCGDGVTAVEITSLPTGGTLTDNGAPVAVDEFIPRSDLNSLYCMYAPSLDGFGTGYDNFGFAPSRDGVVSDSPPPLMVINVTFVNQAPSFTASNPPATNEDATVSIPNWADFNPGAPNESSQTATYTVTGVSNPSLFSAGPAVDSSGTLTYTLANLVYGTSIFYVQVQDSGGTANDGCDTSAVLSFTIQVNSRVRWTVNTSNDTPYAEMLNGVPVDDGNPAMTSLRAAITAGNAAQAGTKVIINFAPNIGDAINLGISLPPLAANFTINGPGAPWLTIQPAAGNQFRVLRVNPAFTVIIRGLTIAGGTATGRGTAGLGGGIWNLGNLELYNDAFSGNTAASAGGAIFNSGPYTGLLVYGCLFFENGATDGGAIGNLGEATITGGTQIISNTATDSGGAVWNEPYATLTISGGVWIYNNTAIFWGGGIMNEGDLFASGVTLQLNTAGVFGGGIFILSGSVQLTDVVLNTNGATLRRGGGFYYRAGTLTATNLTLTGNTSGDAGFNGGAYAAGLLPVFVAPQWNNQSVNPDNTPPRIPGS